MLQHLAGKEKGKGRKNGKESGLFYVIDLLDYLFGDR